MKKLFYCRCAITVVNLEIILLDSCVLRCAEVCDHSWPWHEAKLLYRVKVKPRSGDHNEMPHEEASHRSANKEMICKMIYKVICKRIITYKKRRGHATLVR